MRLYLAAAWSRKSEIRAVAQEINQIDRPRLYVQSRWLLEPGEAYGGTKGDLTPTMRAITDIEDVAQADMLVRFTDRVDSELVSARLITGARMFEMGYAYALGKKIVVVGGIQPIFDYLPGIVHVADVSELKKFLTEVRHDG